MNDGKSGKKLSKREEQLRREDVCLRSGWGTEGIDKEPREQNVKSADQLKKRGVNTPVSDEGSPLPLWGKGKS